MNKVILGSFLLLFANAFAQNDSLARTQNDTLGIVNELDFNFDESNLDEITIEFRRKIKLKQSGGKYEVELEGTNFNRFSDAWEGLKNIPLLQVVDNQELKINGKSTIVEIDGIRTELSGEQLESYLRSLNSDSVKTIELITNPGAMYDSNVSAVVNIVLKKQEQQYRFSINENAGLRSKPFSLTNLNYTQNLDKLYIYTNYYFGYSPLSSESQTEINTLANGNQAYKVNSDYISRSHNVQLNLVYTLNEKNKIFLTNLYTHGNSDSEGSISDDLINRKSTNTSNSNFLRLSQIWKSDLTDKLSLKLGSYQIINQSNTDFSAVETNLNQKQNLNNKTPIVIGFADINLKSKLGSTDFGTRFHSINQKNENETFINQNAIDAPFYYNEKVLSFYLSHSYQLSDKQTFIAGIRSESTFSDYSFNNSLIDQNFKDKQEYTNILYNIGYFWNNEKQYQSINFRKQISRPNYSYLNPFRSLSEDITQTAGDLDIKPAIQYSLNYELVFGKFVFSLSGSYIHNFISSFMEEEQGVIVTTYKNFKKVYFLNTGIEYNNYLFNEVWNIRPTLYLTLPKIVDSSYDIKKSSPIVSFGIQNIVNLPNNYMFTLYYSMNPAFKDGLLKHRHSQSVNVSFSKKLNNFNFILYANDLFKTSKTGYTTLLDNYKYQTVSYSDVRNVGLSVRYTFSGKAFKAKEMETINDNTLNRL